MKKDRDISAVRGVFTLRLNGNKKNIVSKINTLSGLYGHIRAVNGRIRTFKFISAREYKKDPAKISISILVNPGKKNVPVNKWQMVRLYHDYSFIQIRALIDNLLLKSN